MLSRQPKLESPSFTEADLERLFEEKLKFNRNTLCLPDPKARSWAKRTVDVFRHHVDHSPIEVD